MFQTRIRNATAAARPVNSSGVMLTSVELNAPGWVMLAWTIWW